MTQTEHNDLMWWMNEFMGIAMKARYSYDWFMQSTYAKLVNDTMVELLVMDAEAAGI